MLEDILEHNKRFVASTTLPLIGHAPRKHTAIVTCMDCRLVNTFEQALGLQRGDVLELRTAGATISTPERAHANNDLIRSLAAGIYLLGVRRIIVVGHTECGLSKVDPVVLTSTMQALGVDPEHLIQQEGLGDINGLVEWIGAFKDVHINVQEVVKVIRNSPFIPKNLPIDGLVINIQTGELTPLEWTSETTE
jgi:Carbonic anhydrase